MEYGKKEPRTVFCHALGVGRENLLWWVDGGQVELFQKLLRRHKPRMAQVQIGHQINRDPATTGQKLR
jgi:hypothetical protein